MLGQFGATNAKAPCGCLNAKKGEVAARLGSLAAGNLCSKARFDELHDQMPRVGKRFGRAERDLQTHTPTPCFAEWLPDGTMTAIHMPALKGAHVRQVVYRRRAEAHLMSRGRRCRMWVTKVLRRVDSASGSRVAQ